MNNSKKYGLNYERKEKKYLLEVEKEIYAHRCRGSFGMYDIISSNGRRFMLTQVKATKQIKAGKFNKEIDAIYKDTKHPLRTALRLVLYHRGKRKVLLSCNERY